MQGYGVKDDNHNNVVNTCIGPPEKEPQKKTGMRAYWDKHNNKIVVSLPR